MTEEELQESFLLCNIKGIGAVSIRKLFKEAGSVQKIAAISGENFRSFWGISVPIV